MAKYEDYAPKKKKTSRLYAPWKQSPQKKETQQEEPPAIRFCLRCPDTPMVYFRNLKLQMEEHVRGSLQYLFESERDPYSLTLLPVRVYICPKCRRTELEWAGEVLPDGSSIPDRAVLKHERALERCTLEQLRQVLESDEFDENMKQAARNILADRDPYTPKY